jgi:hypothetical protein
MGAVYLAHDTQLDRPVALKTPQFAAEEGAQVLERFRREARAAAGLAHPHLCPVYDAGEIDGTPYLTMAYIEGTPLAESARQGSGWPPGEAAALVRQIALALEEAHTHGVIHRDLKPSNIMINRRGEAVVMDFGLARRAGAADVRLTRTGAVMGTPAYMAPEQVEGDVDRVGPGSDVYALGVILYELLTGRLPFQGNLGRVMSQILTEEPVPPSQLRPGLDPRLEAVCRKAMAKRVEDRYASMAALAEALDGYLRAAPPPADDRTARLPAPEEAPAGARPGSPGRRGVWVAVAAAAALVAAALGVVLYIQTDTGTVKIDLEDADAVVSIDGEVIRIDKLGEPITLRVGEHVLTVQHAGLEAETRKFTVKRGKREVLTVELKPKAPALKPRPAAEDGFRPLFNGKDLTGWVVDSGARRLWSVEGGELVAAGSADGAERGWLLSENDYSDFVLRFDFRLTKGANSGVTFRAPPGAKEQLEIQLLDDWGFLASPDTMLTGSLWKLAIDRPAALKPQGSWNTMEVEARGRSLRVTVNGQDTLRTSLDRFAGEAERLPALRRDEGRIGFQNWEGTVRFRNIRLRDLSAP